VFLLTLEINFFNPLHSDEMVEKAVAANSAKVFDDEVAAASGPLGMGYLCVKNNGVIVIMAPREP